MLEPQSRDLLTEHLRPPDGYQLDFAVGTTFSLDLLALLVTPLSFALFDWEDETGQPTADITAIMQALRNYADRIAIFCQAGRIAVPRKDQPLFLHLERSVFPVRAPRPGGLFHPKVWLMRFTAEGESTQYRFLCMSRNLTFDRSWDVCFRTDGELSAHRRPSVGMAPLADFVAALPGLATNRVPDQVRIKIAQLQDEVRRVDFELPIEATEFSFVPLGLERTTTWPFTGDIKRMLVVSPFLGPGALDKLAKSGHGNVLVSRLEALQGAGPDALRGFERTAVMNDAADLDAVTAEEESDVALKGLHAKIFVADMGSGARAWVGSANATDAAFHQNVEFLVELTGSKNKLGVSALLDPRDPAAPVLGDLLVNVEIEDQPMIDEAVEEAEAQLEAARLALASLTLTAVIEAGQDDGFEVRLYAPESLALPPGTTIRCWPIRVGEGSAVSVTNAVDALFSLSLIELTSFFAFEVRVEGSGLRPTRFVLNADLEGAPEDRAEAVLREILKDKSSVLRFLLFLLADGSAQDAAALLLGASSDTAAGKYDVDHQLGLPLFESLMRALVHDPRRLDQVETIVRDLCRTPEGAALIPDGFLEIWGPIFEARRALTR